MKKQRNWLLLSIGVVVVSMLGLIGSVVLAQEATPEAETPTQESVPNTDSLPGPRGFGPWGDFGRHMDSNSWLENLAAALGITTDQLEVAQNEAYAASVADAVAAGQITQAQADRMLTAHALKSAIDRQQILATALGMTVDDLEAALADGQTLVDLMVAQGIDSATLQANLQAAHEAAVQQAVADGVITQAQADAFLAEGGFNLFGHGGEGFHGGPGGPGGRGGRGGRDGRGGRGFGLPLAPDSTTPDTTTPETTDTSFDA